MAKITIPEPAEDVQSTESKTNFRILDNTETTT